MIIHAPLAAVNALGEGLIGRVLPGLNLVEQLADLLLNHLGGCLAVSHVVQQLPLGIAQVIVPFLGQLLPNAADAQLVGIDVHGHHVLGAPHLLCNGEHGLLQPHVNVCVRVHDPAAGLDGLLIPLRGGGVVVPVALPVGGGHDLAVHRGVDLNFIQPGQVPGVHQVLLHPGGGVPGAVLGPHGGLQRVQHPLVLYNVVHLLGGQPLGDLGAHHLCFVQQNAVHTENIEARHAEHRQHQRQQDVLPFFLFPVHKSSRAYVRTPMIPCSRAADKFFSFWYNHSS